MDLGGVNGQSDHAEPSSADRIETHNASVDEELASAGACAHVHLPTGQACVLPHHHRGSCQFVRPDELGAAP